jgi:hypothetical protein
METILTFHSAGKDKECDEEDNLNFGVLTLKVPKIPKPISQSTQQIVLFYNDISASMDDRCADGRMKIQHAVHTTKNLWNMLVEKQGIIGALYAFDNIVDTVIPPQDITNENKAGCLSKISDLIPRGGTNIECALKHANKVISDVREKNPGAEVTFILMTDGNATVGCEDPETLSKYVHPNAKNVFIGYGVDHSAPMLTTLSASHPNASYYFIDQIEKGGLVFGEIFNSIFAKRYTDVSIQGPGLEIYDFRCDAWVSILVIGDLIAETERTFHVRSASVITVTGKESGNKAAPIAITTSSASALYADLTKYLFRQRTQEILFAAQKKTATGTPECLKALLAEIKAYMDRHDLTKDPFYSSLCDDLVITIRTYGTEYGYMYATGRINSNGHERAYNICALPKVLRPKGMACVMEPEDDDLGHDVSQETVNLTRVTPSMTSAMRSASMRGGKF